MAKILNIAELAADGTRYKKTLKGLESDTRRSSNKIKSQWGGVGKSILAAAGAYLSFRAASSVLRATTRAAMDQIKAEAKVEQAVRKTGMAAGFSADRLKYLASEMQKVTGIGDEDILNNVTAQLLTFTKISGENFQRTQQAALDLATVLDGDLKSASIQIGKALNDPIANLSALSRSGIQFDASTKQLVKSLVEQNQLHKAQSIILDEIEKQYGGQAKAQADAMGGIKQAQAAWADYGEAVGLALFKIGERIAQAAFGAKDLADFLGDQTRRLKEFFGVLKQISSDEQQSWLESYIGTDEEFRKKEEQILTIQRAQLTATMIVWENKSWLEKLVGDDTEYQNAKRRVEVITAQLDQLREYNRRIEAGIEITSSGSTGGADDKTTKIIEDTAEKRKNIEEKMYASLGFLAEGYAAHKKQMIEEEYQQMLKLTNDTVNAEIWKNEQLKKLAEERAQFLGMSDMYSMAESDLDAMIDQLDEELSEREDMELHLANLRLEGIRDGNDEMLDGALSLGQALNNSFSKAGDNLLSTFTQLLMLAIRIGSALKAGSSGGGGGFNPFSIATSLLSFIPGLASGGNVRPNYPHIVGERGPELFIPSQPGYITSNAETNRIANRQPNDNSNKILSAIIALNDNITRTGGQRNTFLISVDGKILGEVTQNNINRMKKSGQNIDDL